MKKVEVGFKIVKYGNVTLEVEDDYNDLDLAELAEVQYTDGDLFVGCDDFEITSYNEKEE